MPYGKLSVSMASLVLKRHGAFCCSTFQDEAADRELLNLGSRDPGFPMVLIVQTHHGAEGEWRGHRSWASHHPALLCWVVTSGSACSCCPPLARLCLGLGSVLTGPLWNRGQPQPFIQVG